jgi:hypothetical protein
VIDELKVVLQLVGSLTVTSLLAFGMYLIITGKLKTEGHMTDVVAGLQAIIAQLRDDLERSRVREDVLRQELIADTQAMARMEAAIRDLTTTVSAWRPGRR